MKLEISERPGRDHSRQSGRFATLRLRAFTVAASAVAGLLLVLAASAPAEIVHSFKFSVNGAATPAGTWGGEPGPIFPAASPAGAFYVGAHGGQGLYNEFSSTGAYLCQITGAGESSTSATECDKSAPGLPAGRFETMETGGALDSSTPTIYIGDSAGAVRVFSAAGAYLPSQSFTVPGSVSGLAVDELSGDVYVASNSTRTVYKYDPATTTLSIFATETPGGAFPATRAVAVDNDPSSPAYRDVYVADGKGLDVFDSSGTFESAVTSTPSGPLQGVAGVAVDPANGSSYALEFSRGVAEFDPSGAFVSFIGGEIHPGEKLSANSVAVSPSTGDLFVGDYIRNLVEVFSGDEIIPDVTTAAATNAGPTADTLAGSVNPDGVAVSDCHFEYVDDAHYEPQAANPYAAGDSKPCAETVGSGTSPVAVHADIAGLQAGATYHFRLVAANANGTNTGEDQLVGPPQLEERSASEIEGTTARLNAAVNPDGVAVSDCHFEYVDDAHYEPQAANPYAAGDSKPCAETVGSGTSPVAVHIAVSGLQRQTTYHFRAVASNAAGTVKGPDLTLTTLPPALIDVLMPTGVTTTTATLQAYLDPEGADTTYRFEYGTDEAYGQTTPSADAGSGSEPALASAAVSGLQAATTYHFRTVATNAHGTFAGPDSAFTTLPASCSNEAFRTGLSARLPECRAYEQVSPIDKFGNPASVATVSPSGDRAAVQILGAGLPGANSVCACVNNYLAERGPAGWSTVSVEQIPRPGVLPSGTSAASEDLSLFAGRTIDANNFGAVSSADAGAVTLREPDGSFAEFPLESVDGATWDNANPFVIGSSADLSHILIGSAKRLLPSDPEPSGAAFAVERLYELVGFGGPSPFLRKVSVDSSGNSLRTCEGAGMNRLPSRMYSVSQDGSKIVFTGEAFHNRNGQCTQPIYARVDGSTTVTVSDSPNEDCKTSACRRIPTSNPVPAGDSADASKIFFLTGQQLTANATDDSVVDTGNAGTGPSASCGSFEASSGCNLYEYDFNRPPGDNLVDVSAGDSSGLGPLVHDGVLAAADGSHVYFIAGGVLTSQPNALGQVAQAGAENLYGYDTVDGTMRFLAGLCSGSEESGSLSGVARCPGLGVDIGFAAETNQLRFHSDLTPDGRYLVFDTYAQLTPDDTNQARDVYRYDFQTASLLRVSSGHDGEDQNGNAGGQDAQAVPSSPFGANHIVSDDGQTVVFTTARPLQASAEGGRPEVYEWRQGEVTLVSGGNAAVGAESPRITPSGRDILFNTDQGLLPQDVDHTYDAYDARVGGGFPPPPPPPPICNGAEICHGEGTRESPQPTLGSEVNRHGPEPIEKRCKKGFVKRHGHCVKVRHHKHRRHHRRAANHNRGGAK